MEARVDTSPKAILNTPPTIHDKIREKLQSVLTAMNDYMRNHSDAVKSATSERLISIKNIAKAIYEYYGKGDLLIKDFESNLIDFFSRIEDAEINKKKPDTNHLKLLPELKPVYPSPSLPVSICNYHGIFGLIKSELKQMPSRLLGRSSLMSSLVDAISGSEELTQQLSTNVYVAVFSKDLKYAEMIRRPIDYANYIYEALTSSRIYQFDPLTVTFSNSSKSYNIIFCATKKEAEEKIRLLDYKAAGCFGAEFTFYLQRKSAAEHGQYIPSLTTVRQMDVWQNDTQISSKNAYTLELHPTRLEFIIVRDQPFNTKKM